MARTLRQFAITALALTFTLVFTHTGFAQGTQGMDSTHTFDTGTSTVFIGGPNDPNNPFPIPIDLDPNGPPWTKHIFGNGLVGTPPVITLHETIENIGTEPWFDWHEHVLLFNAGQAPPIWTTVQMVVDGQPINFNALGLQTPDLWLDNFSSPVNPGSILEIWKDLDIGPDYFLFNNELTIEEYPTPEPASLALMGLGGLAVLRRRR